VESDRKSLSEPMMAILGLALGSSFKNYGAMGIHDTKLKEWYCLPLIGLFGGIAVKEDSHFKTLSDLVEALKKNPKWSHMCGISTFNSVADFDGGL